MTNTMTREDALAALDESIDRAADEAHTWIVTELQLNEDEQHAAMQKVYASLDQARAKGLAEIAKIWGVIDAVPDADAPVTLH
jgi:hypothetical protein